MSTKEDLVAMLMTETTRLLPEPGGRFPAEPLTPLQVGDPVTAFMAMARVVGGVEDNPAVRGVVIETNPWGFGWRPTETPAFRVPPPDADGGRRDYGYEMEGWIWVRGDDEVACSALLAARALVG